MKVYLIWDYDEGEVMAVFSTEAKAETELARVAKEWELTEVELERTFGIEGREVNKEVLT